ncbi:hypothetical protein ACA910_017937 [Epithemia clementina (nom. ined.)]
MRIRRLRSNTSSPPTAAENQYNPPFDPQQVETLIPAEIRMISGCHSEQTSADLADASSGGGLPNPAGRAGGACTSALLELLYQHHKNTSITTTSSSSSQALTFQSLLLQLRQYLSSKGLEQIPQLSSSRPLELQQTPFSLSNGPGQRRALLVGINYRGQQGELSGCHNDVINVKNYLIRHQGYSEDQILMLIDDGKHQRKGIYPTRQKIILGLQQLVTHSQPGDNVYFHYSGHGGLLSPAGDEDGIKGFFNAFKMGQNRSHRSHFGTGNTKYYDETLYPVDHEYAGQIRDFSLFHHFVRPLKPGVTATCVLDCCHSGTVLDLPYQYQPTSLNTIRAQQSMDSLGNLAFLYLLAGHPMASLGDGFASVWHHVHQSLPEGTTLDEYQGTGLEELFKADQMDDTAFMASAEDNIDFDIPEDDNINFDNNNSYDYDDAADFAVGDDDNTDDAIRGFDGPGDDGVDANNALFAGPGGLAPVMVVQGHAVDVDPANGDYYQPPLAALGDYAYAADVYNDDDFNNDGGNDGGADCCPDEAAAGCGDVLGAFMEAARNGDDD